MTKLVTEIVLNIAENNNFLTGELTRQTVMQISKKQIKQLISQPFLIVDLNQVTRIDTAGLAWLFFLIEQANNANCQLSFSNVPTKLYKLIGLSGVDGFLPVTHKS